MVGEGKPKTTGPEWIPVVPLVFHPCRWRSPHDACDGLHHHLSHSPWSLPSHSTPFPTEEKKLPCMGPAGCIDLGSKGKLEREA